MWIRLGTNANHSALSELLCMVNRKSHTRFSMNKRELKTAPLAFRVSPTMKAAIDTIARADYRSTSSLIELALAQFIERETTKRGAGH